MTSCSRETGLTVINHSSGVVTNISIASSGFSERIDRFAAGAEYRLSIHSRRESGARVAFDAGEQGYFEGGGSYRVAVIIGPDLNVTVSSELVTY